MSRDPDREMLSGCLMCGAMALIVLVIPIAVCLLHGSANHDINTTAGLTRMLITSLVLASAVTIPVARRFGIAPAFGSLGGFACGAAYWFLHLQQTIVKAIAETGQATEYQDSTMYIVPLVWLLVGGLVSLLPLYKNKRLNRIES